MGNQDNITSAVELITPELAAQYLKMDTVNRPLNRNHVTFLAGEMTRGEWKLNGEAICFDTQGRLVNGQHRLQAVIKAGIPVRFLVARGCEDDSFVTYDSGRNRRVDEVFYLSGVKNASVVSSIVRRYAALSQGYAAVNSGGRGKEQTQGFSHGKIRLSKEQLLTVYRAHGDFFQMAGSFASECYRKLPLMTTTETGALVAYLTLDRRHEEDFVTAFFRMLYFESSSLNNSINLLRERLVRSRMGAINITAYYKFNILAKTWNAYVRGISLKCLLWNEVKEGKISFL